MLTLQFNFCKFDNLYYKHHIVVVKKKITNPHIFLNNCFFIQRNWRLQGLTKGIT